MTSQKRALSHAISLAVNYRLFSHGDVSYRFSGKNDNVVLEFPFKREQPFNVPFYGLQSTLTFTRQFDKVLCFFDIYIYWSEY